MKRSSPKLKVLIIGDLIIDQYRMTKATRLCPEAPVPVLVQQGDTFETRGGAGLVANQLSALIGEHNVNAQLGSMSRKERIFADERLVTRVDFDHIAVCDAHEYETRVLKALRTEEYGLLIVSDYGKGALDSRSAFFIMKAARKLNVTVLVDAKNNWDRYINAFAYFPNLSEELPYQPTPTLRKTNNVIRKLGPRGCSVNSCVIPTSKREVRDTTGAGDVFIAAFAGGLLIEAVRGKERTFETLTRCAHFANTVAGLSVEYVGTRVVTLKELGKSFPEEK